MGLKCSRRPLMVQVSSHREYVLDLYCVATAVQEWGSRSCHFSSSLGLEVPEWYFCCIWRSEQVTGPAQIQGKGKETPLLDTKGGKHLLGEEESVFLEMLYWLPQVSPLTLFAQGHTVHSKPGLTPKYLTPELSIFNFPAAVPSQMAYNQFLSHLGRAAHIFCTPVKI